MSTATLITDYSHEQRSWLYVQGRRVLGELLFWGVVLQLVAGLFLQSQLAAFGGRILVPNGVPKMLLVAAIMGLGAVTLFLARGRVIARPSLLPMWIFACYLVADIGWLLLTSKLPASFVLFGFNKYFLFFAALPAAAILRSYLTPTQINVRLLILLVPLALLALAQYALNDPLLAIDNEDESFLIPALDFYGQIRAFSLFRGVLECGQGLAFFGALLVAQLCLPNCRYWWLKAGLLLLSAAACYVTFRRGAYLEFGAAAISAFAIARRWSMTRWLPWIYLGLAVGLACAGTILQATKGDGVLSSETLAERQGAWGKVFEMLMEEPSAWLFGSGITQLAEGGTGLEQVGGAQTEYFLIDNGFLAVLAQMGLIGLGLWFWVMQSLWRDMLLTGWQNRSALAIGVAALLSTWLMRDMFDPLFALYPLYVFLVFWSEPAPELDSLRAARNLPSAQPASRSLSSVEGLSCV